MSDDNPRHTQGKGNSGDQNNNSSDDAEPLIVTIEPQTKKKYSYDAKQYRLDRARYRLEKKAYCAARWTMIFLIIYTGLTLIVAVSSVLATFVAHKQAKLMQQQVVGTMAAVVVFVPSIGGEEMDKLIPTLENRGGIISPDARISFRWKVLELSNLNAVLKQGDYSHTYWQLLRGGFGDPIDLDTKIGSEFSGQRYTVKIQGSYTFSNGFEDKFSDNFCLMYIGRWQTKSPQTGTIETGNAGFPPCDEFESRIRYIRSHPVH